MIKSVLRTRTAEEASDKAMEAAAELARGRTDLSAALYLEAAELLKTAAKSAHTAGDRALGWFLTASHYHYGGHYSQALKSCRKADPTWLPNHLKDVFAKFRTDAGHRAGADYVKRTVAALRASRDAGEYQRLMELLQDHQYVLPAPQLAALRADCCDHLRLHREAALFYRAAMRLAPAVYTAWAGLHTPLRLAIDEPDEAWAFIRHRLELTPGLVTELAAAAVRFGQAVKAPAGPLKQVLHRQQLELLAGPRTELNLIPRTESVDPKLKKFYTHSLQQAALALKVLNELDEAERMAEAALRFDPDSLVSRAIAGFLLLASAGQAAGAGQADEESLAKATLTAINIESITGAPDPVRSAFDFALPA